ncbi:MAG: hypothetical protein JSS72_07425 [Armatimonadetes bacterium]|nr:hypothetical protein [Armatimonadota bacterium]
MNLMILFALATVHPQDSVDGRYEGVIHMPMIDQRVILDIDHGPKGEARGSIILPGLNVKGESATKVTIDGDKIHCEFAGIYGGVEVNATLANSGLDAEFKQAGNVAPFHLDRIGAAQVDLSKSLIPLPDDLIGTWKGDYTADFTRHLTLVLKNEGGLPVAEVTVVGKRVTKVPVDHVEGAGGYLVIKASPFGMTIEGPHKKGADEIKLTISYAGLEIPFTVRREKGK